MSARDALWTSGLTLINYKGDTTLNMFVSLLKSISLDKSSNLSIFKFLMRNDDVITE